MATIRRWRSYPTHAIDYTICSSEELRETTPNPGEPVLRCCRWPLLEVAIPDHDHDHVEFRLSFPCFGCSGCGSPDDYFRTCEQQLIANLRSHFPSSVPGCCAANVAKTFRKIVESAHASHRCPRPSLLRRRRRIDSFATIYVAVHIQMRPLPDVRALLDFQGEE